MLRRSLILGAPALLLSTGALALERAALAQPHIAREAFNNFRPFGDFSDALLKGMLPGLMMTPGFFGAGGGGPNIANLFATTLYTGNASSRTITTGIDGDLHWIKSRSSSTSHHLYDKLRGVQNFISSDSTNANSTASTGLSAFGSSAVTIGSHSSINANATTYALWSFVRAARFFDAVTWTGDGTTPRSIPHSLGMVPGLIIVYRTDTGGQWFTYHASVGATAYLALNTTNPAVTNSSIWNNTSPTNAVFTVHAANTNANGGTYVAYLFAHDTAADGVVQCGGYTGNGSSTGPTITLGWQPQWLLIKCADGAGGWFVYDAVRSPSNPRIIKLALNASGAEDTVGEDIDFTTTGFQPKSTSSTINANGNNYIFNAIRAAA